MNNITLTQKQKNKHLTFEHYEYIVNSVIAFEAMNSKSKRNIGKTTFIKELASTVGTTTSNVYSIIKDATITILDTHLNERITLCASSAFNKQTKNRKIPNNSKLEKAKDFIALVEKALLNNKLYSIDETINYLKIHDSDAIKDMVTISTKTFYNYVHDRKVNIKPIDLPRMTRRKNKPKHKTYIPKRQKGTSIEERPEKVNSREEFGHWEGDLVVGPRDGQNGAYLTLFKEKN